jgi:polysaccharide export outer membrane protein
MRQRISLLALVTLLGMGAFGSRVAAGAPGDNSSSAAGSSVTSTPPSEEYRLRPDDVLEITVLNQPDLARTVTILPDGTIDYPIARQIRASGLTVQQLKAQLTAGLDELYNHPQVTVSVKSMRPDRISLVGAVKSPGSYELRRGMTVMDALAAGGGLTQRPERVRMALVRGGVPQPIDAQKLMVARDVGENLPLQPDDRVIVQEEETRRIQILGAVARPGPYELPAGEGLLDALALAGGATDKAALTRATLLRGETRIPVNMRVLLDGKPAPAPSPSAAGSERGKVTLAVSPPDVRTGDILVIPENEAKIAVLGEVKTPGYITIPDGREMSVLGAITQSGGATEKASLRQAGLIRVQSGKPGVTPIDLEKLLKGGDASQDLTVQPGDILFIPEKKRRNRLKWNSIFQSLYYIGVLGVL